MNNGRCSLQEVAQGRRVRGKLNTAAVELSVECVSAPALLKRAYFGHIVFEKQL
jgi:hypothetical protein